MRTRSHHHSTRTRVSRAGLLGRLALGFSLVSLSVLIPAGSPARAHPEGATGARIVAYDSATGRIRFIGSPPGSPIARPSGLGASASPAMLARAFLALRANVFGVGTRARDLPVSSVARAPAGHTVVRFQQLQSGVPVLGGELVVNLDRAGNILSAGGETLPATTLSVIPRVTPAAARLTAIAATARARAVRTSKLRSSEPRLWIYDSKLLGGPGLGRPTLVWRVDVTARGRRPVDELVLVDAKLGVVALHVDEIERAKYRRICDAHNSGAQVPCTTPKRVEGGTRNAIRDVNEAYDLIGATYDFYLRMFGRDSLDGAGMPLVSTTRYCDPRYRCPMQNAAWDPEAQQMEFGEGFASADDVVGHELTHAVIDHSSSLFPFYQSGAIGESIADTLGELFDQSNRTGNDAPAARWLLGEDLPIGALRNMKHPARSDPKQPDRMTSTHYMPAPMSWDDGGVHINSGVGNKAAFLITDGGTFNGTTVRGLGVAKAAKIYYELATHQLTSASDYGDLYYALPQACRNLVGTAGITTADCDQVVRAVNAVEMSADPGRPRETPVCPSGGTANDRFFDDLESPTSGNWTLQTEIGDNTWYYPPPDWFTYATSGHTSFWGADQIDRADYSIAMTRSVAIPEAQAV